MHTVCQPCWFAATSAKWAAASKVAVWVWQPPLVLTVSLSCVAGRGHPTSLQSAVTGRYVTAPDGRSAAPPKLAMAALPCGRTANDWLRG